MLVCRAAIVPAKQQSNDDKCWETDAQQRLFHTPMLLPALMGWAAPAPTVQRGLVPESFVISRQNRRGSRSPSHIDLQAMTHPSASSSLWILKTCGSGLSKF